MASTLRCLIFLGLFAALAPCYGQNEYSRWYFGDSVGLNFLTTPPAEIGSSMEALGSPAIICASSGTLLFYTNGSKVWNSQHAVMANGTQLNGASYTQPVVIVKKPGSSSLYYIFTLSNAVSTIPFNYSIVDMTMAAGLGSVTVKNTNIYPNGLSNKMTVTKHCNGTDYWVLVHDYNTANFMAYQLTATGVSTAAIVSSVGSSYTGSYIFGHMKFSPNGKKIAVALAGVSTGKYEVFDFDRSTGAVSNPITLPTASLGANTVAFSPDGSKLYTARLATNSPISQWDLCAGSQSAIVASQYTIATYEYELNDIQLGPDGKIYTSRNAEDTMGVINFPNLSGSSCGYVNNGKTLTIGYCNFGLPNYPLCAYYDPPAPAFTFSYSSSNCTSLNFSTPSLSGSTLAACAATSYSIQSVAWDFGDPSSGSANTSTLFSPSHTFSSPQTFTVKATLFFECAETTTLSQVINVSAACLTVTSTGISCAALGSATAQISTGGPYSYTWFPTAMTGSVVNGLAPGIYTMVTQNLSVGNTFSAVLNFTSSVPLTASVVSSPSVLCYGTNSGSAAVTNVSGGSGNYTYQFTNASTTLSGSPTFSLSTGTWTVFVHDAVTACNYSNTLLVGTPPALTLSISPGTPTACVGSGVLVTSTVSGGTNPYSYSWSNSTSSPSTTVIELTGGSFSYSVMVTDLNGCTVTAVSQITFVNNPTVSVTSASICPAEIATLTASGANTYSWSSGSGVASITVSPSSSTSYNVMGNTAGCTSVATASVTLKAPPIPTVSSNSPVCEKSDIILQVTGGNTYSWSGPGTFNSGVASPTITNASPSNSGAYVVTVTAVNSCTASGTTSVTVIGSPTLAAQGLTVCTIQTISLAVTSSQAVSYFWEGPLSFTSNLANPLIPFPNTSASGLYTITITDASGCQNSATVSAGVVSTPTLSFLLTSASICVAPFENSPVSATLTLSGANTFTVSAPIGIQPGLQSTPPFVLSSVISNPGLSTFTVSGDNGVCTVDTTGTLFILPNPLIKLNGPLPTLCEGDSAAVNLSGASVFIWKPLSDLNANSSGDIALVFPKLSTTYSITGEENGCFSQVLELQVTVNPLPTLTVSPTFTAVCIFSKIKIDVSGNASSYLWKDSTNTLSQTGNSIIVSPISSTAYTVTGKNSNCEASAIAQVSVIAGPKPNFNVHPKVVCVGEPIYLSASGARYFEWASPVKDTAKGSNTTIVPSSLKYAGTFSLISSDSIGCKGLNTIDITVNPKPSADFDWKPDTILAGATDVLFINQTIGDKQHFWNWYFGHDNSEQKTENTAAYFPQPGRFPVALVVYNDWGCADTAFKLVDVIDDFHMYVPNSFTPNGDGLNEKFYPIITGAKFYSFLVFDRWGNVVFKTETVGDGWDGTNKGKACPVGAYNWKIILTDLRGERSEKIGHVVLTR